MRELNQEPQLSLGEHTVFAFLPVLCKEAQAMLPAGVDWHVELWPINKVSRPSDDGVVSLVARSDAGVQECSVTADSIGWSLKQRIAKARFMVTVVLREREHVHDMGVCGVCGAEIRLMDVEYVAPMMRVPGEPDAKVAGPIMHTCVNGHTVQIGDGREGNR